MKSFTPRFLQSWIPNYSGDFWSVFIRSLTFILDTKYIKG